VFYENGLATSILDAFDLEVTGKGGHGSMPEKTIDPLFALNQIYNGLHGITSREVSPFDNAVFTIGTMGGGTMENVIPDSAHMKGTLRSI